MKSIYLFNGISYMHILEFLRVKGKYFLELSSPTMTKNIYLGL